VGIIFEFHSSDSMWAGAGIPPLWHPENIDPTCNDTTHILWQVTCPYYL